MRTEDVTQAEPIRRVEPHRYRLEGSAGIGTRRAEKLDVELMYVHGIESERREALDEGAPSGA